MDEKEKAPNEVALLDEIALIHERLDTIENWQREWDGNIKEAKRSLTSYSFGEFSNKQRSRISC